MKLQFSLASMFCATTLAASTIAASKDFLRIDEATEIKQIALLENAFATPENQLRFIKTHHDLIENTNNLPHLERFIDAFKQNKVKDLEMTPEQLEQLQQEIELYLEDINKYSSNEFILKFKGEILLAGISYILMRMKLTPKDKKDIKQPS